MLPTNANPFTRHPHAVGESYLGHLAAASGYSVRLFAAGAAALVHAILPFLFERTASNLIKAMHADMMRRGAMAQPAAGILSALPASQTLDGGATSDGHVGSAPRA